MTQSFFERPVLNSPYAAPRLHHALDEEGQPLDIAPLEGRRESKFITPVPKPRKQKKKEAKQDSLVFGDETGLSTKEQEYNPTPIINEIRSHVASWRNLANPADWAVTTTTATLLRYWRSHNFESVRPFFCQVEAVETVIWLTEVARREKRYAKFWEHIRGANEAANPELVRIAMKMATGSGKTTVMAMLIAWQTLNAVRSSGSSQFSKGFLTRRRRNSSCTTRPDRKRRWRPPLPRRAFTDAGEGRSSALGPDRIPEGPRLPAPRSLSGS